MEKRQMTFQITLTAVFVLLLCAVPGYILIKCRMVSEDCISGFSKVLLYVVQPCLAVYTFRSVEFSTGMLINFGVFALISAFVMIVMLVGAYLILRPKYEKSIYRIMTVAVCFANCAFFCIPILEAIIPDLAPGLIVYTTVFAVVMNTVGWTVGAAIISQNTKYISPKKIFLNPATLGFAVAMLVYVFNIPIQEDLGNMINSIAGMATPLSMIIMGMRLGTIPLKSLFVNPLVYVAIAVKQIVMPLFAFGVVYFLPIPRDIAATFFVICACPVASVVLNFAEIVGSGQKEAANTVLLGTMLSIVTLPLVMLLFPLFGL